MSTQRFSPCGPLLLLVVLVCARTSVTQQAARPERGTMPNRTYSLSDIENISLQNGNVNLSIPLASLPPIAGGKLSWTINANYNSKLWNILRVQADAPDLQWNPYVIDTPSAGGGWQIGGQYMIVLRSSNDDFSRLTYPANSGLPSWELNLLNNFSYWKMVLIMPDGSEHEFRPLDYSPYGGTQDFLRGYFNLIPNGTATRYYSVDGTYMFAKVSSEWNWTVYMPDGTQATQTPDGVQRITDTNNNKIKIFTDADGTHYQDEQTGREIKTTYDPSANGGQGQAHIWYPTVTGLQHHIDINFGTTSVQGQTYYVADWMPQGGEGGGGTVCQRTVALSTQLPVVREIVFPQTEPTQPQQRFTFTYNSDTTESASNPVNWSCGGGLTIYSRQASRGWGELSRVVTPSGSIVDYSYAFDSTHLLLGTLDDLSTQSITQKKITHDGAVDTWTYAISEFGSSLTAPDGNNVAETKYCTTSGCATGKAGLVYRTSRPFSMTERHWTNLTFSGAITASPGGILTLNPVVDFEYTLLDASNNPLKMSAKAFQFDYNGNATHTTEYDRFDPALVSRDAQGVPTGVPASATVLRVSSNSYYNQASTASSANVYANRNVSTGAPLILNAIQQTTVGPAIIQFSYDGQGYGLAPTVGNLTTRKVWADLDNKWITTNNTYDTYGNVATATDARGKVTQFFYDDAAHALPTRVMVDPQNGTGTQTTITAFDYSTGLVTSQTDVNGQVTSIDYTNQLLGAVDPFGRPGIIKSPTINIDGNNHRRRVTTTYLDAARQVIVESDLKAENDKLLKTRTTTDMLGRPTLSESTEDGTNYTISIRNAYLDVGRVTLTSTAMRSTAASTDGWTRVTKDGAGRVTEVATFGGATQPAWSGMAGSFTGAVTTSYTAEFTTVTDQAGKLRRSMMDALGRLVRVDEPNASGSLGPTSSPVQPTSYEYDVFDNLKKVIQGAQQRTFAYDSLSRLRTAINPESGTVNYKYDDNGNLVVRTDARSVSSHYEYDSLNRVTRRWYNGSDSTSNSTHNIPALPSGVGATDEVKFYHDSQSVPAGAPTFSRGSAIGRLVAQTHGSGSNGEYYSYDVLGRQTLKIQQVGSVNYQLITSYTLAGAVSSLTYPSGHTINNVFDNAGRLTTFGGNLGDGTTRTYSTGIVYSSLGSLLKEQFGTNTPVYHKRHHNSRGQLCDVRASTVNDEWDGDLGALANYYSTPWVLCGNGSGNNGNVLMTQTIVNNVYFEDRYSYDALNRLTAVNEYLNGTTFSGTQQYDHDRWGNRTLKPASTLGTYKELTVNTAKNQLGVPTGQPGSMSFDDAGNLINDTYTGNGSRTYDAENKMTSAVGTNSQAQLYAYDAAGQRIKRTINGVETWQIYGFDGELLAEYAANAGASNPQREYGYRNEQLLVTATAGGNQVVSWTNTVGVSVAGASLTKTASTGWGNAGASSMQSIVSGDGYVEVTASETSAARILGLSHTDSNQSWSSVDFAFDLDTSGVLYIFESGNNRGTVGTYATGDKLRVAIEGGVVKYKKNGAVLYTSMVAPTYPLVVDTSLYSNGATLNSVAIGGNFQSFSWTNTVGVSVSGNNLTKTATTGWGNAGASSMQTIASGDGYVEVTATQTTTARIFGLAHTDANQGWTSIDFAFDLDNGGTIYIFESGNNRGTFGTYATGDKLRVAIESGIVKYKKNGTVLYTSSVTPTYPLLVDTALYSFGSVLSNVVLGPTSSGPAAQVQWLVSDHLGTPRMIIDQTGTMANVQRHDYLPFGEEMFEPIGGRSQPLGYVSGDGVRQQFTSKERDIETGLDFFEARYYSSTQGRFTSPDEFSGGPDELYVRARDSKKQALPYAEITQPESLNKYTYVYNNPCRYIDPDGHCGTPSGLKAGQTGICVASFIASAFVPPGVPPGRGDWRGPNGQGGTSRIEVRVAVDLSKGTVTKTDETMGRSGAFIKDLGPKGEGGVQVSSPNKDHKGNLYFQISQHGSSNVLGALGSIDNHLNVVVTPDGKVGVTPSSTAKDYPALEIYKYTVDDKGNVTTTLILHKKESGNMLDLSGKEKAIQADPK